MLGSMNGYCGSGVGAEGGRRLRATRSAPTVGISTFRRRSAEGTRWKRAPSVSSQWPCGSPRLGALGRPASRRAGSLRCRRCPQVLPSPESAPLASEAISRLPHSVCSTPKAPARMARIRRTSAKSVHPRTRKTCRTGPRRRVSVMATSERLSDTDIDLDDVIDIRAAVEGDADVRAQGTDGRNIA
jgi:hypothetical protein